MPIKERKYTKALPRAFFNRDPPSVCRELLGKVLVRRDRNRILAGRIVEVEAYLGLGDPAAHSASGRTLRNAVLFGPPGFAYVYFIYGNHYCLNVSCLPDGEAGGILFRALEPIEGIQNMAKLRGVNLNGSRDLKSLTSGPGRLAEAFGITRVRDNEKDLTDAASGLFIADDGYRSANVSATARIGITKAAKLPLRFVIPDSQFLSGPRSLASREVPGIFSRRSPKVAR